MNDKGCDHAMKPLKLKLSLPMRSFLFRLIAANTVVFVISLLILSIINYTYTNRISEKQISETHRKLLDQTDANIEMLYERVFQVGEQLLNDKDVIKSLYATRIDPVDSILLEHKLHDVVNANEFINSVYLYNGAAGRFIHSIPQDVLIDDIDPEAKNLVQIRNGLKKMIFLPHKQQYTYSDKTYDNPILSLILNPSDARSEYAIFINLKLSAVQDLFDKMGNASDSSFMIMNKNGLQITQSDRPNSFLDARSSQGFKVIQDGHLSGSFVDTVNGSKSLVTYVYNEKLEWYLVNTTRYAFLAKGSFMLQRNIMIVSLFVLLVCLLATILLNRKLYGPIGSVIRMVRGNIPTQGNGDALDEAAYLSEVFKNLIGRVTSLEDSAVKDQERLKESLLRDLLLNEGSVLNREDKDLFARHGLKLDSGPMRTFLIMLERMDPSEEAAADQGINLIKETVFQMARRVFDERMEMEKVDMGHHAIALIMYSFSEEVLSERLDLLIHQVERVTGLSPQIGVGCLACTYTELALSYGTAKEALSYRFVNRSQAIYDYDDIQAQVKGGFRYPVRLERLFFENIKMNDKRGVERVLSEWFHELKCFAVADIRSALNQSAVNMENEFAAWVDFSLFTSAYGKHTLEAVIGSRSSMDETKVLYEELSDFLIERLKLNRHRERGDIVNQACEYIGQQYRHNSLSADSVAAELSISVPYFSKLFNEMMGSSFTQYVTDLRLNEAEYLLLSTSLSVKEIGESVGFQNSSYFITVFKKKYGASPNQFRNLKKVDCAVE